MDALDFDFEGNFVEPWLGWRSTLTRVMLVSRRFHALGQPLLSAHVVAEGLERLSMLVDRVLGDKAAADAVQTLVLGKMDGEGLCGALGILYSMLLATLPQLRVLIAHDLPTVSRPLPSLRTLVCWIPAPQTWANVLIMSPGLIELRVDGVMIEDDDVDWPAVAAMLDGHVGVRGLRRVALKGGAILYPPLRAHLAASTSLVELTIDNSGRAAAHMFGRDPAPHDRPFPNPSFTALRTLRLAGTTTLDDVLPLDWIPLTLHRLDIALDHRAASANVDGVEKSIMALRDCITGAVQPAWRIVTLTYAYFAADDWEGVGQARSALWNAACTRGIDIEISTVNADTTAYSDDDDEDD